MRNCWIRILLLKAWIRMKSQQVILNYSNVWSSFIISWHKGSNNQDWFDPYSYLLRLAYSLSSLSAKTSMWKVCCSPPSKPASQRTRRPTSVWFARWQCRGDSGMTARENMSTNDQVSNSYLQEWHGRHRGFVVCPQYCYQSRILSRTQAEITFVTCLTLKKLFKIEAAL